MSDDVNLEPCPFCGGGEWKCVATAWLVEFPEISG